MKDEIKEIFRLNCDEEIDVKYFAKDDSLVDTTMDYSQLLDYITNLQEENEDIKNLNNANYLSFIDVNKKRLKAIEYIKENGYIDLNGYDLLDILGGDE